MSSFFEMIQLIEKIIKIPRMSFSDREKEIIKEGLLIILENNPNYGSITKRDFKLMLENTDNYFNLYCELEAYAQTHNLSL